MNVHVAKDALSDFTLSQQILELSDSKRKKLRDAFNKAIHNIKSGVDLDLLEVAIGSGSIADVFQIIDNALGDGSTVYEELNHAWNEVFISGGVSASESMSQMDPTNPNLHFNPFSVQTAEFVSNYQFKELNANLSESVRQTVHTVIRDSVKNSIPPRETARQIRDSIGLTARDEQAVLNFESALRNSDVSALQRKMNGNDARAIRAALRNRKPLPESRIRGMVDRYRARLLKVRAEAISRTESLRAVNSGVYQAWKNMVDAGELDASKVRRKWIYTHDDRTRAAHVEIPVLNPEGVGIYEPFKSSLGPILYPHDPSASKSNTINCRCTTVIRLVY